MIKLEHLHTFAVVAQEGNVTQAAQKLFRTQPAVSAQLRQLNDAFGEPLYQRHQNGIVLTHAGQELLAYAQTIQYAFEGAKSFVGGYRELKRGSLKVASSLTVGVYLLPELLSHFEKMYPEIDIQLMARYSREALELLIKGDAQLAFVEMPQVSFPHAQLSDMFRSHTIFHDEVILVAHPEHPWACESAITPEQLTTVKIIWPEKGSGTRRLVERMGKKYHLALEPRIEVTGIEAIKQALLQQLGVAFLSRLAVRRELADGRLVRLAFKDSMLQRPFTLVHPARELCSYTCRVFVDFVHDKLHDLLKVDSSR